MSSRVLGETKVWGCPSSSNRKPKAEKESLKMLELSNSMSPQYISFLIFQALNSSAYNAISCQGLDMNLARTGDTEADDNESPTSYLKHLKILIHSRKWLRLEFHRCLGVEYLLCPEKFGNEGDGGEDCKNIHKKTEVDFLLLKFRKSSPNTGGCYDPERHRKFFVNLWTHWKVRKLSLSMDFTPEWSKEFCRPEVSVLEELQINPECKFHRYVASNHNDENEETSNIDNVQDFDCWELFCRELRGNHPNLKSLSIYCKTSDSALAYLIDHAIAPAGVTDPNSKTTSFVLPIEKLFFSKLCSCDESSLLALSRALRASSATQCQSLTISRGVKLPSRASLDAGLPLPPRPQNRHGLLDFCRSLRYAPALRRLTMGDYILDEFEMGALFESLVLASGKIQKLSLFDSAATTDEVYEKVLCGGTCSEANHESPSCLIQNQLPHLRFLHLPREALKALLEVLKYNTSIEWINHTWRTKTHEYYLDLNRGGRRILTTSAADNDGPCRNIRPTLWPRVLERASSDLHAGLQKGRYCGGKNRKYDVVYHLLRNQILLQS